VACVRKGSNALPHASPNPLDVASLVFMMGVVPVHLCGWVVST
jgi:hypothetical protein